MKPPRRAWFDRGTLRQPGPHLDRMAVGIDLGGISLAEGLRAAVASGLPVLISVWIHSFPLLLAAFAANLACFCDAGGPVRVRVKALLAFTMLGAATWAGFGLLRNLPWPVVIPFAAAVIFVCSMARVWGLAALAVGNVLIVTVALALDAPLSGSEALGLAVSFLAGGLWAVLLTLGIWRIHRSRPATRAVAQAWDALARLATDLRGLAAVGSDAAAWDAHARAHRRGTRILLDDARQHVAAAARARGPTSAAVRQLVLRFEAAEIAFAALIALSDLLENGEPATRLAGARALRVLRPVLLLYGKGVLTDPERLGPVLMRVRANAQAAPSLAPSLRALGEALLTAVRVSQTPDDAPFSVPFAEAERSGLVRSVLQPLRENMTWKSAVLRHAVRATIVTVPAIAWSLVAWTPYAHWLTITVALTMQPYFAATWQRVLERVAGTLLGGLIGAGVAFLPSDGLTKAALLVPLCVIGFSVRQVSYGAYIACLTPLVVVLFDVAQPGHADTTIALMRFSFTVFGGALAVAASLLLWPRWDSRQLRDEIARTLLIYADFAEAVFAYRLDDGPAPTTSRRTSGVASNNLEAALSRALQEPRRVRKRDVEAGLAVDAALRRLGGILVVLQHEPVDLDLRDQEGAWRRWIGGALTNLASGRPSAADHPDAAPIGTLRRLGHAILAIEAALVGGKVIASELEAGVQATPARVSGATPLV